MSAEKEGFAARWSRLKQEREIAEPEPEAAAAGELAEPEHHEPPDDTLSDAELLEKYELPDPDAMKAGDDFSVFMKKAIPERLRRRALRNLWLSNPALANLDELVDYGEDFTDAATVIENMQTVYQVGRGAAWKFKEEQEHLAALAEEAGEEEVSEEAEPDTEEAAPEEEPPALAEAEESVVEITDTEEESPEPVEEIAAYRPRPMRFSFE